MTTQRRVRRVTASGRPLTTQEATHDTATMTRVQRLAREAAEAAELRAYQTHPDVVALRVEQVRSQVDRLCWAGIVLGLAFTMTNVQGFAAGAAPGWSLPWLAAWLLDPMVSLVLLAILRAEQVTARYQVRTGWCVRRAKWFTLGATPGSGDALLRHRPLRTVRAACHRTRLKQAARALRVGVLVSRADGWIVRFGRGCVSSGFVCCLVCHACAGGLGV